LEVLPQCAVKCARAERQRDLETRREEERREEKIRKEKRRVVKGN